MIENQLNEEMQVAVQPLQPDIAQIRTISINEYTKTEFATFHEKPFTVVDSLVLAQLSYMDMSGVAPRLQDDGRPITIQQLYRAECFDQFIKGIFMPGQQRKLIDYVCSSPRFRDIKLNYYVKADDTEREKQFSAVTFFLPTGETYVAFRGTDDSINGWKEDFNMFYLDTIPGQLSALNYLKIVAWKTEGPIYIGGHSKGGNLALYAGSFAPEDIRQRIVQVYNHDGPGLSKGAKEKEGYTDISGKLNTTLPHESVVGLVFSDGNYNVVSCRRIGLLQHDTFRWEIYDGDFIYEETVKGGSNKLVDSIHQLVDRLDVKDREIFVDTMFDIIYSAGATNLSEFPAMAVKSRDSIMATMKNLPPETADLVKGIVMDVIKNIAVKTFSLPEAEKARFAETINKITETTEKIGRKVTDTAEKITRTKDKLVADSSAAITSTTEKIVRTTDKLKADTTAVITGTTEKLARTKDKLVSDTTAVITDTTEKINLKVADTAEKITQAKNKLTEKLSAGAAKAQEGETGLLQGALNKLSEVAERKADGDRRRQDML